MMEGERAMSKRTEEHIRQQSEEMVHAINGWWMACSKARVPEIEDAASVCQKLCASWMFLIPPS